MNFKIIENLPKYNLYNELNNLISAKKIKWHEADDQICLNSTKDDPNNYFYGRGSLIYDWDNSYYENNKIVVPKRKKILEEKDFTELCEPFKNTYFENVYIELKKYYNIGRVRIMKSKPKTCLTWHVDNSFRIHYPIKTQEGCFMVIDNEIKHLTQDTWWWTNTILPHTAFNSSIEERIHLVAAIL